VAACRRVSRAGWRRARHRAAALRIVHRARRSARARRRVYRCARGLRPCRRARPRSERRCATGPRRARPGGRRGRHDASGRVDVGAARGGPDPHRRDRRRAAGAPAQPTGHRPVLLRCRRAARRVEPTGGGDRRAPGQPGHPGAGTEQPPFRRVGPGPPRRAPGNGVAPHRARRGGRAQGPGPRRTLLAVGRRSRAGRYRGGRRVTTPLCRAGR